MATRLGGNEEYRQIKESRNISIYAIIIAYIYIYHDIFMAFPHSARHDERVLPCRVILLAHLAVALGHVFLLEQPSSARFGDLPRWRKFVEDFVYVPRLHHCADLI